MRHRAAAACLVAGLLVTGAVVASKAKRQEAVRAGMAADRAFAETVRTKDVAAFRNLVAEGATFFSGRGPKHGRQAVCEAWAGFFAPDAKGTLWWEPESAQAAESGDLAYTVGRWEMRKLSPGGGHEVVGKGRYLTVWRREADGVWRVEADIGCPEETEKAPAP